MGRCARQGDPGSIEMLVAPDDELFVDAPCLAVGVPAQAMVQSDDTFASANRKMKSKPCKCVRDSKNGMKRKQNG